MTQAVLLAYEVLGDHTLRQQYDELGLAGLGNKYRHLKEFLVTGDYFCRAKSISRVLCSMVGVLEGGLGDSSLQIHLHGCRQLFGANWQMHPKWHVRMTVKIPGVVFEAWTHLA
jgi:hypothetical protein